MQVLGGSSACSSRQPDNVASLNSLPHLHQVARLMAVKRFQTIVVTNNDAVAITKIRPRTCYNTTEGSENVVVGACFNIYTRVSSLAAIRTNYMTTW